MTQIMSFNIISVTLSYLLCSLFYYKFIFTCFPEAVIMANPSAPVTGIPSLAIHLYPDEDDSGINWVSAEFAKFLKDNHSPLDTKVSRRDAIFREIRGYKNGTRQHNSMTQFSFQAVLKYIFHHTDDFRICQHVATEVESSILKSPVLRAPSSIYDIYCNISQTPLKHQTDNLLLSKISSRENDIPTLCLEHKEMFTSEAWSNICLF